MTKTKSRFILFVLALAIISTFQPYLFSQNAPLTQSQSALDNSRAQAPSIEKVITEYAPPPDQYQKAAAYSAAHYRHFFVDTAYGLLVMLLLLRWRVAPKFRDWAERVTSRRFLKAIIYAPALLVTLAILGAPTDAWDHVLDRSFGLSLQNWGQWLTDWITTQIVVLVVGIVLVWILYAVIRRSPRRWWLYFWMASIPFLLFVSFIQPLVIAPLFNTFKPLLNTQPELVFEIERVVQRGGADISSDHLFEMEEGSKETDLTAYVVGLGPSKRAVLSDTIIAKATVPEIQFVFGHEMGHYVLNHIPKEIAIASVILLGLLYLGFRLAHGMLARWGEAWGIRNMEDWASFPLLLFLLTALTFLATPVFNAVSRHFEHEADRYGLEVIHGIVSDPQQVAARFFEKSGEINLADPDPNLFVKIWMFDHPTRPERVHFAVTYDPWSKGEEPKYVH
jgi:STE24 endopeptidase